MQNNKPTHSQMQMLQVLASRAGPVDEQELDGRIAKALLARGWARLVRKGVEITDAGGHVLQAGLPECLLGGAAQRAQAVLQAHGSPGRVDPS